MAIAAADLQLFSPLNTPEDDVATGGGAIDPDGRPTLTQLAATDDLEVLSSQAADTTQGVTVEGRDAAGAIISDTKTLSGTTPVAFTGTFERVHSVLMDADATGVVTVRRDTAGPDVYAIPIGERGADIMFKRAASESGATTRYDKCFWLNNHGTLTLNDAEVQLTADPASVIRQGVHTSKDDTATITNRVTAPGGVTFVDDAVQQNVPSTTLVAAETISVWIELQLTADNAPIKNTFTTELAGTSA